MTSDDTNLPKRKALHKMPIVLTLLLLAAAASSAYFFHQYREAVADNPGAQQRTITQKVGSLVITPKEQAQLATVKDASRLTSSALASRTQNGDILLVYGKSGRIIIYRPSLQKVVDML